MQEWDEARILKAGAGELSAAYRAGQLSPVEVMETVLAEIASSNPRLLAFVSVRPKEAMRAARDSALRWAQEKPMSRLDGVPISVKDLVDVEGMPTRRGSAATFSEPAFENAPAVKRALAAGLIVTGKTATSEFGWQLTPENPLTGTTVNPAAPERTPGGSSAGAAAAAAAGLGPIHLGTDGGGSIRVPAAFCGVVGFKPTFGAIPHAPSAHTRNLFHLGFLTRCVDDARAAFDAMLGRSSLDTESLPSNAFDGTFPEDLRGLRIGFYPCGLRAQAAPDIEGALETWLGILSSMGAKIMPVGPAIETARDTMAALWQAGASRILEQVPAERHDLLDPDLRAFCETGRSLGFGRYIAALEMRDLIAAELHKMLDATDILVMPTVAVLPFAARLRTPDSDKYPTGFDWSPYAYLFNFSQQPACSLPVGRTSGGLPIGLQIIAQKYNDRLLLRVASLIERRASCYLKT